MHFTLHFTMLLVLRKWKNFISQLFAEKVISYLFTLFHIFSHVHSHVHSYHFTIWGVRIPVGRTPLTSSPRPTWTLPLTSSSRTASTRSSTPCWISSDLEVAPRRLHPLLRLRDGEGVGFLGALPLWPVNRAPS